MASPPFSALVATEGWRAEAESWTRTTLSQSGIAVTGPVEQPRIRPWSTQLTIPTDHGRVWFKACCDSMAFEPGLQRTMAGLVPGAVAEPLAVDTERGWMLTFDHGPTVGDRRSPTVEDWRRALASAAEVQRSVAAHRDALLAVGLPDGSPATVVQRFDRLTELQSHLPEDQPGRVPPRELDALRSRRPLVVEACTLLDEGPLPSTWNHGDLHPWNLFGDGEHVTFFDLGDGTWSHATEILAVPYGSIADAGLIAWDDVLPAWTEVWGVDEATLAELRRASRLTHAVNRATTWYRALQTASAAEVDEWGVAVVEHLTSMLDA